MTNHRHSDGSSLLKKYLEGKCTAQEKALVEEWYLNLGENKVPADNEMIADLAELQKRLKQITANQPYAKGYIIALAAAILAFFRIGVIIYSQRNNDLQNNH